MQEIWTSRQEIIYENNKLPNLSDLTVFNIAQLHNLKYESDVECLEVAQKS